MNAARSDWDARTAEVHVTLEIRVAVPDGAKDDAVRTVSDNARTLKFQTATFERE